MTEVMFGNLDENLMFFGQNGLDIHSVSLFKLPVAKLCSFHIAATAGMVVKHLSMLSVIL
jgi:hypothetical protein